MWQALQAYYDTGTKVIILILWYRPCKQNLSHIRSHYLVTATRLSGNNASQEEENESWEKERGMKNVREGEERERESSGTFFKTWIALYKKIYIFARLASVFLFRQRDLSLVKVKSHFASDISHTYKNGYSYYSVILFIFQVIHRTPKRKLYSLLSAFCKIPHN